MSGWVKPDFSFTDVTGDVFNDKFGVAKGFNGVRGMGEMSKRDGREEKLRRNDRVEYRF